MSAASKAACVRWFPHPDFAMHPSSLAGTRLAAANFTETQSGVSALNTPVLRTKLHHVNVLLAMTHA